MGFEDAIGSQSESESCIVCDKPVRYGTGFAHIKQDGEMVTLCCPLCFETFQKKPKFFLLRAKFKKK